MSKLIRPLLMLIAGATDRALASHLQYLKEENCILRGRLPKHIRVTDRERRRLLRFGKPLGSAIKDLITIVTPRTFARWVQAEKAESGKRQGRKTGRPRTAADIRELIERLAKETGWGYARIQGELRRLGIRSVSRTTILNILRSQGIDPAPGRGPGTWAEFLQRHAQTLYACDFFTKRVWTLKGPVEMFLLVFIHIGSRRIWVSRATAHPNADWMAQQARNMCMVMQEQAVSPQYLIHDRDTKFTRQFNEIFRSEGVNIVKLPIQSPNLNAHCERVIGTIKQECLDYFMVFSEDHLNHIVSEFVDYYNRLRPHQALGNLPLGGSAPPEVTDSVSLDKVVCHQRLGGVLKHYERLAA